MSIPLINLPTIVDGRGQLSVMQNHLPFSIERLFWITKAKGQIRGGHRHKTSRQAAVAIGGRVDIFMDNGPVKENVCLSDPSQCLIIEPEYWHSMTFFGSASLLVFASNKYDPDDYIFERP